MPHHEKLLRLEQLANDCLETYGLKQEGWSFSWDRAQRRYGCCNFADRKISLSKHLARLNQLEESYETVLHEVAHAIAGPRAGHGPRWKEACRLVGARPVRCYSGADVVQPSSPYVRYCPNCFRSHPMYRRSNRKAACAACCTSFNGGRYAERYRLRIVFREAFDAIQHEQLHPVVSE